MGSIFHFPTRIIFSGDAAEDLLQELSHIDHPKVALLTDAGIISAGIAGAFQSKLAAAGIPVESTKGEASAGQEEVNVRYDEAVACAERIKALASSLNFPGLPDDFRITISMGVTRYLPVESIDAIISRADAALYQAKSSGKNKIAVEEPPHRKACIRRIS